MSSLFRAFFDWLRRGRAPAQHPSLDDRWVQRAIQERLARKPASLVDEGLAGVRLGKDLKTNLSTLRRLAGDAPDLVVRHLHIAGGPEAAVVFFETLGRAELVANQVIKPLTHDAAQAGLRVPSSAGGLEAWIREQVINSARVTVETDLREVVRELCHGKTALLVQGLARAIIVELLGLDTRNVQEPVGEPVVRGPRDGFVESLQTNMSLIRRRVGSPLLRFERLLLGRWTKTPVVITYLRGLAPDELIEEVRRRITAIDIDGIIDTSYIEEFIEDTPYTVFPQVLNTERPDVVVANLLEGRVAIMAEGSPFALIVPTSLWALMNAAEDYYQRWDGATLVRLLRYALVALMLLFPSVYVAATTFHPEMLPSPMLISIAAAREAVPFSSFTEVLLMEITFEALREAGVRLPRPIGQTIGIVGAIVIGEAAVSAQIVSAPVVIIVAFTGISSFVVPHFNVGVAFRIARFFILILAGSLGLRRLWLWRFDPQKLPAAVADAAPRLARSLSPASGPHHGRRRRAPDGTYRQPHHLSTGAAPKVGEALTWVVILVFAALWIPDLPAMLRRQQWPELVAFAALWAVGLTLALLVNYGVDVNQVTQLLRALFEPIGKLLIQQPPV